MKVEIEDCESIVNNFKLMSHPVRLCILTSLIKIGEVNVSFIQKKLELPQSTISQHLQKLKSAKLISARRHNTEIYYSVSDKNIIELIKFVFKENK